ncbi:hypothetical protein EV189_1514 [Motilibacter rhizosphaerae]|uniref:Tic20 family protein n=1 Tax=Motilibacter rhizosphaerae TaxID=598652 RepID=A0A4Q7NRQ5_9ACTN|nr:DUF4870 domain-containing protein [Motilibacter rhizosphaerae]RZS89741.1 hypothetical protein EV189_1514 [Motilibacter rhizosphaerae]
MSEGPSFEKPPTPPGAYAPPPGPPPGPAWGPPPGYGRPPTAQEDRMWALGAHLSGLVASLVLFGFLGPLVVLLVQGPRSPWVRRHAVEALNFWILLFGVGVLGIVVSVLTLGFGLLLVIPVGLLVMVLAVVFSVQGAVAASNGLDYRYPVNLRIVS